MEVFLTDMAKSENAVVEQETRLLMQNVKDENAAEDGFQKAGISLELFLSVSVSYSISCPHLVVMVQDRFPNAKTTISLGCIVDCARFPLGR